VALYPDARTLFEKDFGEIKWKVNQKRFEHLKFSLVLLRHSVQLSGPDNQDSLIEKILANPLALPSHPGKSLFNAVFASLTSIFTSSSEKDVEERVRSMCHLLTAEEFLKEAVRSKEDIGHPTLHQAVDEAVSIANTAYGRQIEEVVNRQVPKVQQLQMRVLQQQVDRGIQMHRETRTGAVRRELCDRLTALQSNVEASTRCAR